MAYGRKTGGRQPGTPNKATSDARRAIGALLDGNAHRLIEWIDEVATGIRKVDPETGLKSDEYVVKPNPARAFDMYQSLLEFHVPKRPRDVLAVVSNPQDSEHVELFGQILRDLKARRQEEAQRAGVHGSRN